MSEEHKEGLEPVPKPRQILPNPAKSCQTSTPRTSTYRWATMSGHAALAVAQAPSLPSRDSLDSCAVLGRWLVRVRAA